MSSGVEVTNRMRTEATIISGDKSDLFAERWPRFGDLSGPGAPRGLRLLRTFVRLRPASQGGTRGRGTRRAIARRGAAPGGRDRPGSVRRLGAHGRYRCAEGPLARSHERGDSAHLRAGA